MAYFARFALSTLAVLSLLALWGVWIWNEGFAGFNDAMEAQQLPDGVEAGLEYSGVQRLDDYLRRCVFMTMPVVSPNAKYSPYGRPLIAMSLVDLAAMTFIMVVEAERRKVLSGKTQMTFVWLAAISNLALAVVAPLYALVHLQSLTVDKPFARQITLAKTTISTNTLATVLGLVVPSAMLLDPWKRGPAYQSTWLAVFAAFPASICVFNVLLSSLATDGKQNKANENLMKKANAHNQAFSRNIFLAAGMLASVVHGLAIVSLLVDKRTSIWDAFVPSLDELRGGDGYSSTCLTFMKLDYALSAAVLLVIAHCVLDVRYPYESWFLAIGLGFGSVILGAGGVLLFVWASRESWLLDNNDMDKKTLVGKEY